ncbi:MAG: DUF4292 domain-containing protein [Balneolaceae bacterium]
MNSLVKLLIPVLVAGTIVSCASPSVVQERGDIRESSISADSLYNLVFKDKDTLMRVSGKGRAIVSQKGGSDRVTVEFFSDQSSSLLNIRSGIGIEGGQVLVKDDSVLVYNKVDKYARISPLSEGGTGSDIGSLASVNIIDLLNYSIEPGETTNVLEDESFYIGVLGDKGRYFVEKKTGLIREVEWKRDSPYRQIIYEGYASINGFELPRKITILSADGNSQVVFLVQNLIINNSLPELTINIPDNIPVTRI